MADPLPALLTVEEAARVLRIGRTKAYAMAQEWRDSGGQSGLPVIDLGNVLRVPLAKLEELAGGQLDRDRVQPKAKPAATTETSDTGASRQSRVQQPTPPRKNHHRAHHDPQDQLNLFHTNNPTS
jgi:hypothetical protein